jgi:hypothetical protein
MLISLRDAVARPDSPLAAVGSGGWTGGARQLVLVDGGPAPADVDGALAVVSAADPRTREALADIAGKAAGLVVVGDDALAERIAAAISVPVAVPAPSGPASGRAASGRAASGRAGLPEVWAWLNGRAALSAARHADRMAGLAAVGWRHLRSAEPGARPLTAWAAGQLGARVRLVAAGADPDGWRGGDWAAYAEQCRRQAPAPVPLDVPHHGHVVLVDSAGAVLLAERAEPWEPGEPELLAQVARFAAMAAWADDVRGQEMRFAQAGRRLRAAALRRLMDGHIADARRTLEPVLPGFVAAGAGAVALVEAAPHEGPAVLSVAIDRAAGGRALIVPVSELRAAERRSRQVVVVHPGGARELEALLEAVTSAVAGRTAGGSATTPWQGIGAAVEAAEHAWASAAAGPGDAEARDGRVPLPELLGADARGWAKRLLQGLRENDDARRAELLRVTEVTLWSGPSKASRLLGMHDDTVRAHVRAVAEAVGLDAADTVHAAVLYLAVRLGALPDPVTVDQRVTLREALGHDGARQWAQGVVGRLDTDTRTAVTSWLRHGRDATAAGGQLGVSQSTVYNRMARARQATGLDVTRHPGQRLEMALALLICDPAFRDEALGGPALRAADAPAPTPAGAQALVIDTGTAHSARVYDYFLGGTTNFPADRAASEKILAFAPSVRTASRECRGFGNRATAFVAGRGVDQFIDIGTGIPTSPNLHEIAQGVNRFARVVYVDHDPIVLQHAEQLMEGTEEGATAYVHGDFYEGPALLDRPEVTAVVDFGRPVALCLNNLLHFVPDEDAYARVAALVARLAPGSMLTLSQTTTEFHPELVAKVVAMMSAGVTRARARTREEFARFFTGLELVEPGIVCASHWRPEPGAAVPDPREVNALAAVGRVVG